MVYAPQTWVDGSGGGTPITAARLAHIEAGVAAAVPLPAAAEQRFYVSRGLTASDANDGRTPGSAFATIGAAVAARGSNPGIITLGYGTHTITAADVNGNGVTQDTAGQRLDGLGVNLTTVLLNANLTWGIQCTAQFCEVSNLLVTVAASKTVTYAVGVSTPASTGSAQSCRFDDVYVGVSGTCTAGFALGPDWPGSSAVDIANTTFTRCVVNGPATHGFLAGNGTTGNVLQNRAVDCQAISCGHALTIAGGGIDWTGGGTNSISVSDFLVTHNAGQAMSITGARCEGGKRFLDVGYVGPIFSLTLDHCFAGGFTNSDNEIIEFNAAGPLHIFGGYYDCGAGTKVTVDLSGAPGSVNELVAVGVGSANTTPGGMWPPFAPTLYLRSIIGALYTAGGVLVPDRTSQRVIDDGSSRSTAIKSANYTLSEANGDDIVVFNGASLTATIPNTVANANRVFTVKNYNASALTVSVAGGGTVDGAATLSLAQWGKATLFTIGSGIWLTA